MAGSFFSLVTGEHFTTRNTFLATTVGSSSWTVPSGVISIIVEAWGAGGGAMGQDNTLGAAAGGAYASSLLKVSPGNIIYYNVGTGGTGGQSSGGTGGDSWAQLNVNAIPNLATAGVRATGGKGAPFAFPNNSNQTASIGNIIYYGGAGGSGAAEPGGGASASSFGQGINGSSSQGGTGGASPRAGSGGIGTQSSSYDAQDGYSNLEGGGGGGGNYWNAGGMGGIPGGGGGPGYGLRIGSTTGGGTNTNTVHGYGGDGGRGQIRIRW
jgi:hypothetical protein